MPGKIHRFIQYVSLIHRRFAAVRLILLTLFCGRGHICIAKQKQYHENYSAYPAYPPCHWDPTSTPCRDPYIGSFSEIILVRVKKQETRIKTKKHLLTNLPDSW